MGTIFTSHPTVLGRAMSSVGKDLDTDLNGDDADELAGEFGVQAKHSLEKCNAREADVFTTVSSITASEAERFLGRRPEPILPNGIDLQVVDAVVGDTPAEDVRRRLTDLATRVLDEDVSDAVFLCISGRSR